MSPLIPATGQSIACLSLGTGIALGVTDDFSDAGFRDGVVDLWKLDVKNLPRLREWCIKSSLVLENIQDLVNSNIMSPLLYERGKNNRLLIAMLSDLEDLELLPSTSNLHTLMIGGGKSRYIDNYRMTMELGISVVKGGSATPLMGCVRY